MTVRARNPSKQSERRGKAEYERPFLRDFQKLLDSAKPYRSLHHGREQYQYADQDTTQAIVQDANVPQYCSQGVGDVTLSSFGFFGFF